MTIRSMGLGLVALALASAYVAAGGPPQPRALAVLVEPGAQLASRSNSLPSGALRVDLPVAWQLTRARMITPGRNTLTESFRETWALERRPSGFFYLQSPRARVEVFAASQTPPNATAPEKLMVTERDLARLVGIATQATAQVGSEPDVATPVTSHKLISLSLRRAPKQGADVTIAVAEDEHYDVHIALGSQGVF